MAGKVGKEAGGSKSLQVALGLWFPLSWECGDGCGRRHGQAVHVTDTPLAQNFPNQAWEDNSDHLYATDFSLDQTELGRFKKLQAVPYKKALQVISGDALRQTSLGTSWPLLLTCSPAKYMRAASGNWRRKRPDGERAGWGESFLQRLLSSDRAYNENRVWHQGRRKRRWIRVCKKKKSIPFLFSQSNPKGRLSLDNLQQHTAEQVKHEAQVSGTVGLKGKWAPAKFGS